MSVNFYWAIQKTNRDTERRATSPNSNSLPCRIDLKSLLSTSLPYELKEVRSAFLLHCPSGSLALSTSSLGKDSFHVSQSNSIVYLFLLLGKGAMLYLGGWGTMESPERMGLNARAKNHWTLLNPIIFIISRYFFGKILNLNVKSEM